MGTKIDGVGTKIDDMASGLGGKLDEINENLDASGVDTGIPEDDTENVNGELPEDYEPVDLDQNFLEAIYDDLLNNNPFTSIINQSELTASGNCSMNCSINVLGRSVNIDFSICDYDLTIFRNMMLVVSTLTAFFIVFRKN